MERKKLQMKASEKIKMLKALAFVNEILSQTNSGWNK